MDIKGETASSKLGVRLGMRFRPIRAKKRVGAPREIRTPDQLVRSQLLYPAELWARSVEYSQDLPTGHRPFALFSDEQSNLSMAPLSTTWNSMIYSRPKTLKDRPQDSC